MRRRVVIGVLIIAPIIIFFAYINYRYNDAYSKAPKNPHVDYPVIDSTPHMRDDSLKK
jgi:hypothetical protein